MKILIASEDLLAASVLSCCLHGLSEQTEVSTSRTRMCTLMRSGAFDVLLTTFCEPFLDGQDLGGTIPGRRIASPAIFVLSWSPSEWRVMSLCESGVDQYMTLPCDMSRLRARIAMYAKRCGR